MPAHRSLRDFDWLMLILVCAICALGVLQIYSATRDTHFTEAWWKQGVWILAGFIALWIGTLIDYHTLLGQAYVFYGLAAATLAATFAIGMTAFGSRRWIGTSSYHIQVSEFVKLVIVLLVARYLSELKGDQLELRDLLKLAGLVGLPMALVMIQPDLGTALTYLPILGVGVFLAGFRWQYAAAIVVIVAVIAPISYWLVLKDYQRQRVVSFLDPSQDPK
jgi:rod shape determining protein RodA